MAWKKKKRVYGSTENYSLIKKLRDEKRSCKELESMLSYLSMEEIIGLKLELSAKSTGGKFFGFNLWQSIPDITKDALLKFAFSVCRTNNEGAALLGISKLDYIKAKKKFKTESYFKNE